MFATNGVVGSNNNTTTTTTPKTHFEISCVDCRQKHLKCDKALPTCDQCYRRGVTCIYEPPKKRGRQPKIQQVASEESVTTSNFNNNNNVTSPTTTTTTTTTTNSNSIEEEYDQLFYQVIKHSNSTYIERLGVNISSKPKLTVPRNVSISERDELFGLRVLKIMWMSSRAVLLLVLPSDPNNEAEGMIYRSMEELILKCYPEISDLSDIQTWTQKYTSDQLFELSAQLFAHAKECILHPDLYSYIATNQHLAQSCTNLAVYVLGTNGNLSESKLLMSGVKVFLELKKGLLDMDTSVFTGPEKESVQVMQKNILAMNVAFWGTKLSILVNHEALSYNDMERLIDGLTKIYNLKIKVSNNPSKNVFSQSSGFETMRRILREERGLDRFFKFSQICNAMRNDLSWIVPLESQNPLFFWVHMLSIIEYHVAVMEYNTPGYDEETYRFLKNTRLMYANRLVSGTLDNLQLFQLSSPGVSRLFLGICNIHYEQAFDVITNSSPTIQDLNEILSYLNADLLLINIINRRNPVQELIKKSFELRQHIDSVSKKIQNLQVLNNNQSSEEFLQ